ncbi:hypothetical protein M427DRAFT_44912 [Gonapodya prolifera JEL478]|uniref:Carbohydrate esterase family 16 protein n=1 Tax=Gonapodya prolifera (strain JEL478) TaxID=1344416 RepID=A0A139ADJ3_GONPJ|nr:hypothetical protein M427DRAFT_44912 [Gonapodya prolifera JEL478]|eukprot:KXS14729.1 hypothetical protein M427DRAFT_44912 [Gonapodya prolifera JEL478]
MAKRKDTTLAAFLALFGTLLVVESFPMRQIFLPDTVGLRLRTARDILACPPPTPREHPPTSVHDLRIDDFKIVMALGDRWDRKPIRSANSGLFGSVTTGFGAKGKQADFGRNFYEKSRKTMGRSSGEDQAFSFATVLALPLVHSPSQYEATAKLVAAATLASPRLLSIFITSNDLCAACNERFAPPSVFAQKLEEVLLEVRNTIPRTVVNIALGFNISGVYTITNNDPKCDLPHHLAQRIECPCAGFLYLYAEQGAKDSQKMDDTAQQDNSAILALRQSFLPGGRNYDPVHKDTFAVVVDPGFSGIKIESWPSDMLSDIDCFHPSARAHAWMAGVLCSPLLRSTTRNNHQPIAEKQRFFDPPPHNRTVSHGLPHKEFLPAAGVVSEIPLVCPTSSSRIPTN